MAVKIVRPRTDSPLLPLTLGGTAASLIAGWFLGAWVFKPEHVGAVPDTSEPPQPQPRALYAANNAMPLYNWSAETLCLPIGATGNNLKAAIAGETHEYTDMYPGMARTAREEGFGEIADWFETLAKAERSHAGRFQKALDGLDK